ncbi:VOC family protein [Paenibacillus paeoniae]|uniref:VOC family protein n=1 Tax=Paenibacillus paeoniae TaxID=2292705 RepID=A0A371PGA6_9BACL|nr:VOC family protein [Paenibacillus paeoniae]REK75001.1 VOC family protein [Paenibacillus paeoniae]
MKLNHINLTVTDVSAARDFLMQYFGLKLGGERGRSFAALFDDNGMMLTLMKAKDVKYPATFHIGFSQESEEKVNEIYSRLVDDGFLIDPPQRAHAWTFYVEAPGGFTVEVMA